MVVVEASTTKSIMHKHLERLEQDGYRMDETRPAPLWFTRVDILKE